ncbi:AAA-type ATPase domain protein [Haloferax gibbonsii]|uniref:AAA-type ATPase domain protein n=1 Tax=Haloferax gibbonsii TaxID=35746 RepID=A0A871BJZ2_HALGI|nr:AAA family ATPase [Haloferax gibbonsii]QOS13119.1 AAA-type ATPase domain protein [Haloferax gibbonsii]
MKISSFRIEEFAKKEYTENQTPEMQNLDGDSVLISGPNRSGKTLTFNALLYGLLGYEHTIATRTGGGNKVWVTFSDGSRFFRGKPREYEVNGEVYETDSAEEKLRQQVGDVEVLKHHFLHSHIEELPLERLSPDDRLDLIISVMDGETKTEIDRLTKSIEELEQKITRREDRISPLENKISRLNRQVGQQESQLQDWQTILDLYESGRLNEIDQTLNQHKDLRQNLEELSSERRGLQRKINSKEKELEELQRYDREVEEIIVEAIKEFVCPVCNHRVDSNTAEARMTRSKRCPFCNQQHSIQDLKDHLRDEKASNEGRPGELTHKISEHRDRLNKIESEIESIEQEIPAVAELNSLAVDKLRDSNTTVESLGEVASTEVPKLKESLKENRSKLESRVSELDEVHSSVSDLEATIEDKRTKLEHLKTNDYKNKIGEFETTWSNRFSEIAGGLSLSLKIFTESGEIALPGGGDGTRYYDRRGDLSDSEIHLVNLSFTLALNHHANRSDTINWQSIVLDEPFSYLDEDTKETTLEYLRDSDLQVFVTSSDDSVKEKFDRSQTLELVRRKYKQTKADNWV